MDTHCHYVMSPPSRLPTLLPPFPPHKTPAGGLPVSASLCGYGGLQVKGDKVWNVLIRFLSRHHTAFSLRERKTALRPQEEE